MVYLPHWPIPHVKNNIMLGLERITSVLKRMGDPHLKLPPVIHVAGTNGKGSTIAYLRSIFENAGLKVHQYISPHLVHFNERIVLAGQEISDAYLYEIMEETRIASIGLHTTFFEATTAAAFLAFSKVEADVLLLEVGMGGVMDATNVILDPILSIITPISFDHVEFLGDSITQIAIEKAGIIKPNCPTICSWQMKEAIDVIIEKCHSKSAELYSCINHWNFEVTDSGFLFHDHLSETSIQYPFPNLVGLHQIINAAAVVAACNKFLVNRYPITQENIVYGLQNTIWPARMQRITTGVLAKMLPPGFELWLDGAHNTGGAQMISATIANNWQDKPTYLINGRTGDRDIKGFLEYFKGLVNAIYGVKVISEPKSEKAENIKIAARELGFEAYACDSLKDAITCILDKSDKPVRILAIGSLYLAGDFLLANQDDDI